MQKKFGALSSSVDGSQLSATVSGAILSISVLIIWGAHLLGFNIGNADISNFATSAGISVSFLWMLFGIVRKIVVALQQKWSKSPQAQA